MNSQRSNWKRTAIAAGMCLLLTGCGGGGEEAGLETYDIGENSAASLDTCLTPEEGGTLLSASPTKEEMEKLLEKRQKAAENAAKEAEKEAEKAAKEASKEAKKALKEAEKAEKAAEKDLKRAVKEFGEGSPEAQTATDAVEAASAEVQQLSAALPAEEDDKKKEEGQAAEGSEDGEKEGEGGEDAKEDKKAEDGKETAVTFSEAYTYTYENVPAAAMERYAEALKGSGFKVIDMERMPMEELPDFGTDSGYVIFAKNGAEDGTIFVLDVSWMDGIHTIVVRCPHGTIKRPPSAESSGGAGGMGAMTLGDMVSYVSSLQPADLGLSGASMSEYTVIPVEGNPMVDGQVCRHVNVYKEDPNTGTNTFQGSYLIGGSSIYKKNAGDNTVEKIR